MTLLSNTRNTPSDFCFKSYRCNTGKTLIINTLDLTDIFYDSKRPRGIISSTSMLVCGQIAVKRLFAQVQSERGRKLTFLRVSSGVTLLQTHLQFAGEYNFP